MRFTPSKHLGMRLILNVRQRLVCFIDLGILMGLRYDFKYAVWIRAWPIA